MNSFLHLTVLTALLLAGCAGAPRSVPASKTRAFNVFAAASLTEAFSEIGREFEEANPGVTVTFNFAGSQALRTQIEEGAPADVFASANKTEMDYLLSGGLIAPEAPRIFLTNRLVVILPAGNPAGLEGLQDLARPGLKLVLAAEEVPVGRYTRQALEQMSRRFGNDFKSAVLANVVSNEDNVRQVVAKVALGEADAGIVYTSDTVAASGLATIQIPEELNVIAEYPIAPLVRSAERKLAATFVEYLLSVEGQAILRKWGFAAVE